jgi:hypothetical protein
MTIEQVAQVAHEVNKAYCSAIGDDTQVEWDVAPKWQKDSAIDGVRFHLENPHISPEQAHGEWARHKRTEGWSYGPEKDVFKKEHPNLADYKDLSVEQKAKDYFFRQLVRSLAKFIDK